MSSAAAGRGEHAQGNRYEFTRWRPPTGAPGSSAVASATNLHQALAITGVTLMALR